MDLERIVDGLAETGRSVYPGFLSPDEVTALREEAFGLLQGGSFRQAGVGRGAELDLRPEIRSDLIHWLEGPYSDPQRRYLDQIEELRLALNRALYLGLFSFEGHLAIYPPGAFYKKHLDRFQTASHRIVSCILYLNKDWREEHGGWLRTYDGPEEGSAYQDVLPMGGTLVTFLSGAVHHEVLPATRERVSLTGWFRSRASS